MRLAVVVAPPISSESSKQHTERVTWLGDALARAGFRVALVRAQGDLAVSFARALAGIERTDTVLVHVSGALAENAALLLDERAAFALAPFGDAIAARAPARAMIVCELADESVFDPIAAAERVDEIEKAFGVKSRGMSAAIAVRGAASEQDRFAFTQALLAAAEPGDARTDAVFRRARALPELNAAAKSYALVRGACEIVLVAKGAGAPEEKPAIEPLVALAEDALGRGALDQALAGFRAARMIADARDEERRATLLVRIGATLRAKGDAEGARASYEEALAIAPEHKAALDALVAMATDDRDFARVVELRKRRLATITAPSARVEELVALTPLVIVELEDLEAGAKLLEEARALDASRVDVLETLRRVYEALGRWEAMLGVMDALAARAETPEERAKMRRSQAEIARAKLGDEERAGSLVALALVDDPSDAEGRSLVAERHLQRGDEVSAIAELESLAVHAPERAATYARLFALHVAAGRDDRAFLAALALEELNAAEMDQELFINQYRTAGALRARASLDDAAWSQLRAPGHDPELGAVYAAVARAAVAAKADELRGRDDLPKLDPTKRQEATSTASVVRSMYWAATVLGVECPALYLADDVRGIVAAPAASPSTWLGRDVVRGLSTKELAFLAGRHIAMLRPEHRVALHYPSVAELNALLLATTQLGVADARIPPNVSSLRARLMRHATNDERSRIAEATARLAARGGHVDTAEWLRGITLTAARAGLFVSGDLATAMARLRTEPHGRSAVSLDELRQDLVAFCASDAHAELRRRFAFTAAPSVRPPPPPPSSERLLD